LGFVDHDVVRTLYRLSEFVVLPSYFEGGGFLPLEAWHEGTPIACSNVTSLPEKVGDAALLFDPYSVDEIADALYRMHKDAELRDSLREKGHQRLKEFTWYDTGVAYRALYRKVAGLPLNKEDRRALDRSSGTVSAQGGQ
jgi:glycosyltransferase involved in cell wall biosynthesis